MVSADDEARGKPHSSPPEGHDAAHQADRPVSGAGATAGAIPRPAAGSRPSSGGSLNDGQGKESRPTTRGTVRSHSSGSLSRADTVMTPLLPPSLLIFVGVVWLCVTARLSFLGEVAAEFDQSGIVHAIITFDSHCAAQG
jgi:hypothetical protein